jgi:hypothetical protein
LAKVLIFILLFVSLCPIFNTLRKMMEIGLKHTSELTVTNAVTAIQRVGLVVTVALLFCACNSDNEDTTHATMAAPHNEISDTNIIL